MPTILLPKDVFVKLKPTLDGIPSQGILFGLRQECLDRGLIVQVKGFVPYLSSTQDLVNTIAKHMNWNGQTVLGWFAAPTADILEHCDTPSIASAYFRSIQSAMLKVITANYLRQHSEYNVEEITPQIAQESCALFQDLIGLVIGTVPSNASSKSGNSENIGTSAQAFVSTPSLSEVLQRFQILHKNPNGDVVEENIRGEISQVLSHASNGLDLLTAVAAAVSTDTINNNHQQDNEEDVGELSELNSVWRNNKATNFSQKPRTRRASTTDIDSRPMRSAYGGNIEHSNATASRKRKDIDGANSGRATKKKTKTTGVVVEDVIPVPFNIIPGQGSEYLRECHGVNSLHHSTDFDESTFSTLTASFFTPIENLEATTSESSCAEIPTPVEQRINIAYNAITYHLTTHTQEKIQLYEQSCQEYEMLLEILEGLGKPEGDDALVERLEMSMNGGIRRSKERIKTAETIKENEIMVIESKEMTETPSFIEEESKKKELAENNGLMLKEKNGIEASEQQPSQNQDSTKIEIDEEPDITDIEPLNSEEKTSQSESTKMNEGEKTNGIERAIVANTEEGEVSDEHLLAANDAHAQGHKSTVKKEPSPAEEGEIVEDTGNMKETSSAEPPVKSTCSTSPLLSAKNAINARTTSRQPDENTSSIISSKKSPGWAWDDEELG